MYPRFKAIDPKTIPWVGMDEIDGAAGEGY